MTLEEVNKLLKLIALITAGVKEVTSILENKASQSGMTTAELLDRAERHNEEALDMISRL